MNNGPTKYCVLGAGSSGLTVAKNLKEQGLAFDVLEREDEVGGNWYYGRPASSVYASTHMISSKRLTEYTDFPMPADYPPYPHHAQVWEYLRSYARAFGLYEHIQFRTSVERVWPADGHWKVRLASGEERVYRGVAIANGHNWDPRWPNLPGRFDGTVLHSSQYKTPDVLSGQRVLVVGGGNSGCDIAVESALHAARTVHSLRRGYHYVPKFLLGKPADLCGERLLRWRLPLWLRRRVSGAVVRLAAGRPEQYGLPKPDHRLYETHPIINTQLPYFVGHGRIAVKPDIAELAGDRVRFADGSVEPIDLIIYATGFNITLPFIDRDELNWRNGRPELFMNVFHPRHDRLCVAGLIQPDSGQFGLVDYQGQLIARFWRALDDEPATAGRRPAAERFRKLKSHPRGDHGHGIRYMPTARHLLEVEHFSYRQRLQKLIAQFR
ncbi:MAG TPA: NAD(P)-binding domain-containing protein [Pirellulales bacterium]|nr:NAD(P)-binding domain-containing protein [Pirellulales bacterium]